MKQTCRRIIPLVLLSSAVGIPHASAETIEELDAMADITQEEESGIQYAQGQAERGELLDAIASLERVLANHPKSQTARLLHAVYLCRIDDRPGGTVELGKLKKKKFPEETWNQAAAICAAPAPAASSAPAPVPAEAPSEGGE